MKVKLESIRNEIELGDLKYGELFVDPVNEEMGILMRINPDSVQAKLTSFSKVIAVSLEDGEVYGFGPEDREVFLVEGEFRGKY
jgi:hypothetical protein